MPVQLRLAMQTPQWCGLLCMLSHEWPPDWLLAHPDADASSWWLVMRGPTTTGQPRPPPPWWGGALARDAWFARALGVTLAHPMDDLLAGQNAGGCRWWFQRALQAAAVSSSPARLPMDAVRSGGRVPANASWAHLCGRGEFAGDAVRYPYHINAVRLTPVVAPFVLYLTANATDTTVWDNHNVDADVLRSAQQWLPAVRKELAHGTLVSPQAHDKSKGASTALHWVLPHTPSDGAGRCYVLCLVDHTTGAACRTLQTPPQDHMAWRCLRATRKSI